MTEGDYRVTGSEELGPHPDQTCPKKCSLNDQPFICLHIQKKFLSIVQGRKLFWGTVFPEILA